MSERPLLIAVALELELRALTRAADAREYGCFPARPRPWKVWFGAASHALRRTGPGTDAAAAAAAAEPLLRSGDAGHVSGIVVAGICGALDPALQLGDVVVPERGEFADGSGGWEADPALRARLAGNAPGGSAITVPSPLWSAAAKRELRERTGATICEMEATAWAAVAADRGVPFAMVRAVSDTAAEDLPDLGRLGDPHASRWSLLRLADPRVAARLPGLASRAHRAAATLAAHLAAALSS